MAEKSIIEWLFDDDVEFVENTPMRPIGPMVCQTVQFYCVMRDLLISAICKMCCAILTALRNFEFAGVQFANF